MYPIIKRSQRRLSGKINCSCSKEQILNRTFYSPRKAENFLINNNFGRLCFSRLIIKIHCIAIISREGLPKMSDWDKGSRLGQLQFKTWRKPIHMTYRIHQLISAHPTPTLLPSSSPSPSHLNLNKLYLLLGRLTHLPTLRCRTSRMQHQRIHLLTWVTMRLKLKWSTWITDKLPGGRNFPRSILQKPCFVTFSRFDITVCWFVTK